jgi:hypothetical protein
MKMACFRAMTRALCVALILLSGCVHVANPFMRMAPDYSDMPVETMHEIAHEIEAAVKAGEREARIEDRDGIIVNTPEIEQAIRTRAARSELVRDFLSSGHAIEKHNGLIAILRTRAYKDAATPRERDRNALLVMGENNNRWAIYEGIVDASRLSPKNLSAIQAIFHEERVKLLAPGQRHETPDGTEAVK